MNRSGVHLGMGFLNTSLSDSDIQPKLRNQERGELEMRMEENAGLTDVRPGSHLLLYMQWETIQGVFTMRIPK